MNVITDHGWLLAPGGLPKADVPKHLTATRWSRCAIPEPGAQHGYTMTSWFWDSAEAVVLAPGVYNAVSVVEIAADKGAQRILMPVTARKQLFELPDELATKVTIVYYADVKDALLKALSE